MSSGCLTKASRKIEDNAWHRFEIYANRVRKFKQVEDVMNLNILRIIMNNEMLKSHCIFPKLQTLDTFHINDWTPIILIERIIPPSLRFLQVISREGSRKLDHQADIVGKMLSILTTPSHPSSSDSYDDTQHNANQSAELQFLALHAIMPSSHLDKLVSLRQLRFLFLTMGVTPEHIGQIDYLQHLSTLPHLHDLGLTLQSNELFRSVLHDGFPSLERLTIQSETPSLQHLLYALPPSRLKDVKIYDVVYDWSSTVTGSAEVRARLEGWNEGFGALVRQAETLTAVHITLHSNTASPEDMKECAMRYRLMSLIRPLLQCRALQTVELEGFLKMPYSDADIHDIAVAWPEIKRLVLPQPLVEVDQPTLMALKLLLRLCHHLQKLSVELDMVNSGITDEVTLAEQFKHLDMDNVPKIVHPLKKLDVCESVLRKEDVPWLVGQLHNWFPNLKYVTATAAQNQEAAMEITAALQDHTLK
jgi:hypothetical protein